MGRFSTQAFEDGQGLTGCPRPMSVGKAALYCSVSLFAVVASASRVAAQVAPATVPTGGAVTAGSATIATTSGRVDVRQTSDRAVINWQTYNIGSAGKVVYQQPSTTSAVLNRIVSGSPSTILGAIEANGQVFLVNPAGITFGKGASVNVGAFVASVLSIRNDDFMAGRNRFSRDGATGTILNLGTISARDGGYVALLAPELRNEGLIEARLGTVAMAAGDQITLTFAASGLTLQVAPATIRTLIENRSVLVAQDGSVILTTKAADALTRAVINNSGVIEAGSLTSHGGVVRLEADTIKDSGTISVAGGGGTGGTATLSANSITLKGAGIDASGRDGGGAIAVGDWSSSKLAIDAASTLDASAATEGAGGSIKLIAQSTKFAGSAKARGISAGGTVETSGGSLDIAGARVDAGSAALVGAWLLDPVSLTVDSGAASTISTSLNSGTSVSLLTDANTASGQGIQNGTAGDITVTGTIAWTGAAGLSITAYHSLLVNAPITHSGSTPAAIVLAHNTAKSDGQLLVGGPSNPTGAVNLLAGDSLTLDGQAAALITSAAQLAALDTPSQVLSGTYALGSNIDAVSLTSFTPLASVANPMSGVFDGLGHSISNLAINSAAAGNAAPIAVNSGTVRNLSVSAVQVAGGVVVGGLIGTNLGTVVNSFATSGLVGGSSRIGGLVGFNSGVISNSGAGVQVKGSASSIGGLVGVNTGTVVASVASGPVTAASGAANIGGLVGSNAGGSILGSQSLGNVTAGNAATAIGGLVGFNAGTVGGNSVAKGSVSAADGATNIGGLAGVNAGTVTGVAVTATVSAGNSVTAVGGIAGLNSGNISASSSAGQVLVGTAAVWIGGIAGSNSGILNAVTATGSVSFGSGASAVGGLVGQNVAQILSSSANVLLSGGANASQVGGLAGLNTGDGVVLGDSALGGVTVGASAYDIGGLVGENDGQIAPGGTPSVPSIASGPVTVGTASQNVGGLAGANTSIILGTSGAPASASGLVTAGDGTDNVGGVVGYNAGAVIYATGSGTVSAGSGTGTSSIGGVAGYNTGTVASSFAAGSVSAGANAYDIGGVVGTNAGLITADTTTTIVTISIDPVTTNKIKVTTVQIASSSGSSSTTTTSTPAPGAVVGTTVSVVDFQPSTATVSGAAGSSYIGGVAGRNQGTITNLSGAGVVTGGSGVSGLGGLVGWNVFGATVTASTAGAAVGAGVNAQDIGGLVGRNDGLVSGDQVAVIAASVAGGADVSADSGSSGIGGLVGYNLGTVTASAYGVYSPAGFPTGSITTGVRAATTSYAIGGLVGHNVGTITSSGASGAVEGLSGTAWIGGLVGRNDGLIADTTIGQSTATGKVTGDADIQQIGGLVGINYGTVAAGTASGAVSVGAGYAIGLGGLVGRNEGLIDAGLVLTAVSSASGGVTATPSNANSIGGLVGFNNGIIRGGVASGRVTASNGAADVGGVVGFNNALVTSATVGGSAISSAGTGTVDVSGASSVYAVGGFAGLNYGTIVNAYSKAAVTGGTATNYIGGLLGQNEPNATLANSYSESTVNGGSGAFAVGGLVGNNGGLITGDVVTTTAVTSSGTVAKFSTTVTYTGATITSTSSSAATAGATNGSVVSVQFASSAKATVTAGAGSSSVGGLVGSNSGGAQIGFDAIAGTIIYSIGGVIRSSLSSSTVNTPDAVQSVGDLVGVQGQNAIVANSAATGNVTAGAQAANIGGLIGFTQAGIVSGSSASGSVVAGNNARSVGGLIGLSSPTGTIVGTIANSYATGSVSVGSSAADIGGLIGSAYEPVSGVYARGSVTAGLSASAVGGVAGIVGNTFDHAQYGSPVDANGTSTTASYGRVVVGSQSSGVGGLAGQDDKGAVVTNGVAFVTVTVGAGTGSVGGLVGINGGAALTATAGITNSAAYGSVTGVANLALAGGGTSVATGIGGLVGENRQNSRIADSSAQVSLSFGNGVGNAGGLVGTNTGIISGDDNSGSQAQSATYAFGTLSGGATNMGGLVGQNGGTILNAYALVSVTGTLTGGQVLGGLVGVNNGTINYSWSSGAVTAPTGVGSTLGGLVGSASGPINNSYTTATVSSGGVTSTPDVGEVLGVMGGLVGISTSTISASHASGKVTASAGAPMGFTDATVGGLVGEGGTIIGSYATGAVSGGGNSGGLAGSDNGVISGSHADGSVNGFGAAGGLVGLDNGAITASYAIGGINSSGDYAGGLVGTFLGSTISQSYATGAVRSTGQFFGAGGLAGLNNGLIINSYAWGNATAVAPAIYAGGLVGRNLGPIANSYAIGQASASANPAVSGCSATACAGGIAGINPSDNFLQDFWDGDTSGQTKAAGGDVFPNPTPPASYTSGATLLHSSSAKSQGPYQGAGWDFSSIWVVAGSNYPRLQAFPVPIVWIVNQTTSAYGSAAGNPTYTFSGVQAGDTVTPVFKYYNDAGQVVTPGASTPVGTYTAVVSGLAGAQASRYTVDGASGDLSGQLIITPLTVGWSVASSTVGYGSAKAPAGSLTNVLPADAANVKAVVGLQSGAIISQTLPVGAYQLAAIGLSGSAAGNYVLGPSGTAGTLTVTPGTVTIGSIPTATAVYGSQAVLAQPTFFGLVLGDHVNDTLIVTDSHGNVVTPGPSTPAGTYTLTAGSALSGDSGGNYVLAGSGNATGTLVINQLPLTWSIGTTTATYGTAANPLVTFSNLVGTDTVTPTIGVFVNGSYVPLSATLAPGTYLSTVIGVGGPAGGNYKIAATTGGGGSITVKPIVVTWSVADSTGTIGSTSAPVASGAVTLGGVLAADAAQVSGLVTVTDKDGLSFPAVGQFISDAGTYKEVVSTLSGTKSGNYVLSSNGQTGTLTVYGANGETGGNYTGGTGTTGSGTGTTGSGTGTTGSGTGTTGSGTGTTGSGTGTTGSGTGTTGSGTGTTGSGTGTTGSGTGTTGSGTGTTGSGTGTTGSGTGTTGSGTGTTGSGTGTTGSGTGTTGSGGSTGNNVIDAGRELAAYTPGSALPDGTRANGNTDGVARITGDSITGPNVVPTDPDALPLLRPGQISDADFLATHTNGGPKPTSISDFAGLLQKALTGNSTPEQIGGLIDSIPTNWRGSVISTVIARLGKGATLDQLEALRQLGTGTAGVSFADKTAIAAQVAALMQGLLSGASAGQFVQGSLMLANAQLQGGDRPGAIATLDLALTKAPGDAVLGGAELSLQMGGDLGSITADSLNQMLARLPPAIRPAALVGALLRLRSQSLPSNLTDAARSVAASFQGLTDAQRATINGYIDLAAIDTSFGSGGRSAADDAALRSKIADASRAISQSKINPEAKKAFVEHYAQLTRALDEAAGWRNALATNTPPDTGWQSIAMQARVAGYPDIAREAGLRDVTLALGENKTALTQAGSGDAVRGPISAALSVTTSRRHLIDSLGGLMTALGVYRQAQDSPDLTQSQRDTAKANADALLAGIKPMLPDIATTLGDNLHYASTLASAIVRFTQAGADADSGLMNPLAKGYDPFGAISATAVTKDTTAQKQVAMLNGYAGLALKDLRTLSQLNSGLGGTQSEPPATGATIDDQQRKIRNLFTGMPDDLFAGDNQASFIRELTLLNGMRAVRDGSQDATIGDRSVLITIAGRNLEGLDLVSPNFGLMGRERNPFTNGWNADHRSAEASLTDATIAMKKGLPNAQLDLALAGNDLQYWQQRFTQLVLEDPSYTAGVNRSRYTELLRKEVQAYTDWGRSLYWDRDNRDLQAVRDVEARIENRTKEMSKSTTNWRQADLVRAVQSGDVQKVMLYAALAQDDQLAGQIAATGNFVDDEFFTRGPLKGLQIGAYFSQTNGGLIRLSGRAGLLQGALVRASAHTVAGLSPEDRVLLTRYGWINNGAYTMPTVDPTKLGTVTTIGTDFATQSAAARAIDGLLNVKSLALQVATGYLPGVATGGLFTETLVAGGLKSVLAAGATREGASLFAWWVTEQAAQAAVNTATGRLANAVFNPVATLENREQWTWGAVGKEYTQNLASLVTLGLVNFGITGVQQEVAFRVGDGVTTRYVLPVLGGTARTVASGTANAVINDTLAGKSTTIDSVLTQIGQTAVGHGLGVLQNGFHDPAAGARHFETSQRSEVETRAIELASRKSQAIKEEIVKKILGDPAHDLMVKYKGSWEAMRDAFKKGDITEEQMGEAVDLRRRIDLGLANQIKAELGGGVLVVGSSNKTSDLDFSFYGRQAALAVALFNERINGVWGEVFGITGAEAGYRLDSNAYTRPVTAFMRALPVDTAMQDQRAQISLRRNLSETQWQQHVDEVLSAASAERHPALKAILDNAELSYLTYQTGVETTAKAIAAENGWSPTDPRAVLAAQNRLYEGTLSIIDDLMTRLDAIRDAGYPRELETERRAIMQEARDMQGRALYFANEAYLTHSSYDQVVVGTQEAGRAVTKDWLMGGEGPGLRFDTSAGAAEQSVLEQAGYMYHYSEHGGSPVDVAIKQGKYGIRALDYMRAAGIDLSPYAGIVDITVIVDANRGDIPRLNARLAAEGMSNSIGARLATMSPGTPEYAALEQSFTVARNQLNQIDANIATLSALGPLMGKLAQLNGGTGTAAERLEIARDIARGEQLYGPSDGWAAKSKIIADGLPAAIGAVNTALATETRLNPVEVARETAANYNEAVTNALPEWLQKLSSMRTEGLAPGSGVVPVPEGPANPPPGPAPAPTTTGGPPPGGQIPAAPIQPAAPETGGPGQTQRLAMVSGADLKPGSTTVDFKKLGGKTLVLPNSDSGADPGAVTLGSYLGQGTFGTVYAVEGQPQEAFKIIQNPKNGAASIAEQMTGYNLIKDNPDIPTPKILASHHDGDTEASYLITENLKGGAWAQANAYTPQDVRDMTPSELKAVKTLYGNFAKAGLVWADGHEGNIFFFTGEDGQLRAGVLDQDMIVPANKLGAIPESEKERITQTTRGAIKRAKASGALNNNMMQALEDGSVPAERLMDELFRARYGVVPP